MSAPSQLPLNVDSDDFIAAMNKVIALVKERRRRLSETHSVSVGSRSRANSGAAGSRGSAAPPLSNSVSGGGGDGTSASAAYHLGRTAAAATPAFTEEAIAQSALIRERHGHHHGGGGTPNASPSRTSRCGTPRSGAFPQQQQCFHSQAAADRLPHRHPHAPVLVALAGPAGSGKTSAVAHIVEYLRGAGTAPLAVSAKDASARLRAAAAEAKTKEGGSANAEEESATVRRLHTSTPITSVAVSLDGYHRYRAELEASADPALAATRRGAAFTFNPFAYERDLLVLLDGAWIKFPSFAHSVKDPKEEDVLVDCRPRRQRPATPRGGSVGGTEQQSATATPISFPSPSALAASDASGGGGSARVRGQIDFGTEVVIVEGLYTLFSGDEGMKNDGLYNPNISPTAATPLPKPIPYPMPEAERRAWRGASRLFDLRLYIECGLADATERLVRRHMAAWGIGREEALLRAGGSDYDNSVVVSRTARNADMVLRSVEL